MQETKEAKVYTPQEIEKCQTAIIKARINLLMNSPFFGALVTRLTLINASKWCPTAATDGKHLYYNVDFVNGLDADEVKFLMAHEVMHVCHDHMSRRHNREPKLWNIAADHVINLEIVEQGIGKIIHRAGVCEPCYDNQYEGLISEEVYELLMKDKEKNMQKVSFDFHISDDMMTDPTGENGPVPITEGQKKMLREEIKQEIIRACKNAGKGVPGSVSRLVDGLTEPKVNWREMINQEILSTQKSDYTFMKPAKQSWSCGGIIIPGMPNDFKSDISVAIDTSGSISRQMLKDFLSEVKGIMEQFKDFDLKLWCFDTGIHNFASFTPDNLDDIDDYEPMGGGGTLFECNWEYMKEEEIVPHKFIMFTDGCPCEGWGDEEYCDTIFLISENENTIAPFGVTCHYEDF